MLKLKGEHVQVLKSVERVICELLSVSDSGVITLRRREARTAINLTSHVTGRNALI
jgi:hypothetical protein